LWRGAEARSGKALVACTAGNPLGPPASRYRCSCWEVALGARVRNVRKGVGGGGCSYLPRMTGPAKARAPSTSRKLWNA
jgi:hypothetical protein